MSKLLVVLFALLAYVSAQCSTPNDGFVVRGACACYSGHTGVGCSIVDGTCALPAALPLNTSVVASLDNLAVANDFFSFDVESRATFARYFEEISLSGNSSCSYPSPFFKKSFIGFPDCNDVYTGNFSIPEVVGCGFETSNGVDHFYINGAIQVNAVDYLGPFRGVNITRHTISALFVEISIPNNVKVNTTTPLTVFSTVSPTFAVTLQQFDNTTDKVTITLTTSVQLPYGLFTPSVSGPFNGAVSIATSTFGDCESNTGACFQDTTFEISQIKELNKCNVGGAYTFQWNANCRAGYSGACPVDGTDIESVVANIVMDDPCDKVSIVAHIEGEIFSYPDDTFATPQLVFVAGNTMFFRAVFTSDVSIQSLTLVNLKVIIGQTDRVLVLGGVTQTLGSNANYAVVPGSPSDVFDFEFDATYGGLAVAIFNDADSDAVYTFTVEATFSVVYKTTFGARKRDIQTESFTFKHRGVFDASAVQANAGLTMEPNSGFKAAATAAPFVFAAAAGVANL